MNFEALIKYGDPLKLGGYEFRITGSAEEIISKASDLEDQMWVQMNCNGNPYVCVVIEGRNFDKNLNALDMPKTMGEYRNPPRPSKKYAPSIETDVAYFLVGRCPLDSSSCVPNVSLILRDADKLPDDTVLDWKHPVLEWKEELVRSHSLPELMGRLVFSRLPAGYYTQEEIKEAEELQPDDLSRIAEWEALIEEFPNLSPAQLSAKMLAKK